MFGGGAVIVQPTGYLYQKNNRKYVKYAFMEAPSFLISNLTVKDYYYFSQE